MAPYIFTARNGIYILDLQKTLKKLQEAYNETKKVVADGGLVLFVGTKKQIQETIKSEAERCGMYYINSRWLGGTLTNFATIKTRIARLNELEKQIQAKPILKWAGGKTQMLGDIMPKIPQKYGKYIEPFVGGGALFFFL